MVPGSRGRERGNIFVPGPKYISSVVPYCLIRRSGDFRLWFTPLVCIKVSVAAAGHAHGRNRSPCSRPQKLRSVCTRGCWFARRPAAAAALGPFVRGRLTSMHVSRRGRVELARARAAGRFLSGSLSLGRSDMPAPDVSVQTLV